VKLDRRDEAGPPSKHQQSACVDDMVRMVVSYENLEKVVELNSGLCELAGNSVRGVDEIRSTFDHEEDGSGSKKGRGRWPSFSAEEHDLVWKWSGNKCLRERQQ
jgi:hypothetical protein